MNSVRFNRAIALAMAVLFTTTLSEAQLIRSAAGVNAAAIQGSVDTFRNDLGTLNPNVAGSFGSGRREINWDGVPDALSAPNNLPANFFNVNSPRGAVFSTPGTGFQVSATAASGTPVNFGNIDPSYTTTFTTFSPQRLFTAIGSNIVDVNFFVPGTTTPALTRGFGAVFSDVDLANTTSLEFFNALGASLGVFFAPNVAGASQTLSFVGVSFATAVVARVRITNGNFALGAGILDNNSTRDLVVTDDFIYGEPTALAAVPEQGPGMAWWLAIGGVLLAAGLRRRNRAYYLASLPQIFSR